MARSDRGLVKTVSGGASSTISPSDMNTTRLAARRAAHRVVFMSDGEIVEDSTPDAFFTNPTSDRAKDFLGKILTH